MILRRIKLNLIPFPETPPTRKRETSPEEVSNRLWKAARFAAALHACRISSHTVLAFTGSQWGMLAKGLREEIPHQLTQDAIVKLLELLEQADVTYARIGELA